MPISDLGAQQRWIVDTGEYKEEYCRSINKIEEEPIFKKLSTPSACVLSEEYTLSRPRILVFGQETYGNYQAAEGCCFYEAWSRQIGGYIAFDYAYGGEPRQASGKFWRAFDEIASAFDLPSRRALAWSNLVKVQLIEGVRNSVSITKLNAKEQMTVVKWQRELFHAELRFTRPDAILFLTGGMQWVAEHMFDGYCRIQRQGFSTVTVRGLHIPIATTYHPNARVSTASGRNGAVAHLKSELGF
jgi:hypothetical protein